jgi:uncharacterized membrane protein
MIFDSSNLFGRDSDGQCFSRWLVDKLTGLKPCRQAEGDPVEIQANDNDQNPVGRALLAGAERIEALEALDSYASKLESVARPLLASEAPMNVLRGKWLGHSFHPLATDFPLGAWMSASLLDLIGGKAGRRPAEKLIGFGLLASLPTAAAGVADWLQTAGGTRRVGVVHATVNLSAAALYATSLIARRRGRYRLGVGLGIAGGLTATAGGYLGGHLSLARAVGTGPRA